MDPLRVHAAVKPIGAATGYAADFAVDAIGMNLIAPASELAGAGLEPAGRSIFELADRSQRMCRHSGQSRESRRFQSAPAPAPEPAPGFSDSDSPPRTGIHLLSAR